MPDTTRHAGTLSIMLIDDPKTPVPSGADDPGVVSVYAGTPITLRAEARCELGCDLAAAKVLITDADGQHLAEVKLVETEERTFRTEAFCLPTPAAPQRTVYRANLVQADEADHDFASLDIPLELVGHRVVLNSWGAPTSVPSGERFVIKLGFKCICGCSLEGATFRLSDAAGDEVVFGTLPENIWPGSEGLYFAEIEASAPQSVGWHEWTAEFQSAEATEELHQAGVLPVLINTVDAPDSVVSVLVLDDVTGSPIPGLHIMLHPHRSFTDAEGVARLRVAKGNYNLAVSGKRYIAHLDRVHVAGDAILTVRMSEPPEDDGYPMPTTGQTTVSEPAGDTA